MNGRRREGEGGGGRKRQGGWKRERGVRRRRDKSNGFIETLLAGELETRPLAFVSS